MPGLLVVSHGKLAGELVDAVRRIVADVDALEAVSIGWEVDMEQAGRRIQEAIARVDPQGRRARPHRHVRGHPQQPGALAAWSRGASRVVTGVNLPMLIKCVNLRGTPSCRRWRGGWPSAGRAVHPGGFRASGGPPRQSGPEDAP